MNKKIDSNEIVKLTQEYIKSNKIKKIKPGKPKLSRQAKKLKQAKQKRIKEKLTNFAKKLNESLPESEKWFKSLYEPKYHIETDKYNWVFKNRYIPDVINKKYKYIIEIDGSIHETDLQKYKDNKKDKYYKDQGYKVFRIQAYSQDSFNRVISEIIKLRS